MYLKTLNILLNSSISNLQVSQNDLTRLKIVICLQVGQPGRRCITQTGRASRAFLLVRTGHNIYTTLSKSAHTRSPVKTADTLYFLLQETTFYVGGLQGGCSVSEEP